MSGVRLLDYWSPPDGAGEPVACLATSFTFEADFFTQDCLARFLGLSTVAGEGDEVSSIVALVEEEERLGETQVSVLVDRSCSAEKRNLRWDLLPVHVPNGLLHAKVAVLLWQRFARIILGSANLTTAGYRRQFELALTIDLDANCQVPRPVLDELVVELRRLIRLVPGPVSPPKDRALGVVDQLAARIQTLDLPSAPGRALRLAVAPSRSDVSPLDRLEHVWRGSQPLKATILSPFWDDMTPAPALEAVQQRLTGRPAQRREMTLVAGVDPFTGAIRAPTSLISAGTKVLAFDSPDQEQRNLHAKLLLIESDDWLAALVGSSNATEAGLGLSRRHGHFELNMWLGCPASSRTAQQLRALARPGRRLTVEDESWEPSLDDDEPTTPTLSLGFLTCTVDASPPPKALLTFAPDELPDEWEVRSPTGKTLLTSRDWRANGSPDTANADLPSGEPLPAYLEVHWTEDGETFQATWTANVEDPSDLPPPPDIADLPVDVILAALASTRPLPAALEHELRRRERTRERVDGVDLDPLRRFDDRALLLRRTRRLSLSLWRLQERLGRPTSSIEALEYRLSGPLGPVAIADGLIRAAQDQQTIPGEAHFTLAELGLTIAAVDWRRAAPGIEPKQVRDLVSSVVMELAERRNVLPPAEDSSLDQYVIDALAEARP